MGVVKPIAIDYLHKYIIMASWLKVWSDFQTALIGLKFDRSDHYNTVNRLYFLRHLQRSVCIVLLTDIYSDVTLPQFLFIMFINCIYNDGGMTMAQ